MMAKPCVCDTQRGLHVRCCWGFTLILSLGGRVCLFVELNGLGWPTVGRDSRVDGLQTGDLGLVPV